MANETEQQKMESVDDLLDDVLDVEEVPKEEPEFVEDPGEVAPAILPDPEQTQLTDEIEETQGQRTPTGLPNPMNLQLTICHLPQTLIDEKKALVSYVQLHFNRNDVAKITPSRTELDLYKKYRQMVRGRYIPAIHRTFAAAARGIAAGKPLSLQAEVPLDDMTL